MALSAEKQTKLISAVSKGFTKVQGFTDLITNNRKKAFAIVASYEVKDKTSGELKQVGQLISEDQIGDILISIESSVIHRQIGQITMSFEDEA